MANRMSQCNTTRLASESAGLHIATRRFFFPAGDFSRGQCASRRKTAQGAAT
jgi:hypothetical protein